jgi:hypothetical protein
VAIAMIAVFISFFCQGDQVNTILIPPAAYTHKQAASCR